MLFQKPGLITLTTTLKCSFKNLDWSPLQQPQNVISKTQIDHSNSSPKMPFQNPDRHLYSSPKMLFQKHGLILPIAASKTPFQKNTDWFLKILKKWQPHFFLSPLYLLKTCTLTPQNNVAVAPSMVCPSRQDWCNCSEISLKGASHFLNHLTYKQFMLYVGGSPPRVPFKLKTPWAFRTSM